MGLSISNLINDIRVLPPSQFDNDIRVRVYRALLNIETLTLPSPRGRRWLSICHFIRHATSPEAWRGWWIQQTTGA